MNNNKPFSRALFQANDNLAKLAGFAHLNRAGACWASINKNDYGCDLVYRMPGDEIEGEDTPPRLLEVEVKRTWKGGSEFPYPTINVLYRKMKYFLEGADLLLLADNCKDYLIIEADTILSLDPEELSNKYVSSFELFYQVPQEWATFYTLANAVSTTQDASCYSCNNRSFKYGPYHQQICEACRKCQP